MQRLRTRFPEKKYILPSMLRILSFNEIIDVRRELWKQYPKGTMEYHKSLVSVDKFIIQNHSSKIDAASVEKIKAELKQSEAALKFIKNRLKLKERVLGCADKKPSRKDTATVIVKTGGKAYRVVLKSADICRAESVMKCDFCIPSFKKTNYLHSFSTEMKKHSMSKHAVKDYVVALIVACAKIAGSRPESFNSVTVIENTDGVVSTVTTSSGSRFKIVFGIFKDIFKMNATVITKSSTVVMTLKGE